MDLNDTLAGIVATYLRIDPSNVHRDLPVGLTAFPSSIVMYRMLAALAAATGTTGGDPAKIVTFADILEAYGGKPGALPARTPAQTDVADLSGFSIGIDVEMVANFEAAQDYRAHAFYAQHFTEGEIAAALAAADPLASFCGKYAAKEAVIKADGTRVTSALRDIEIVTDAAGKPHCAGVALSISHTPLFAVAVAVAIHKR